jgi:membrane protease YdiL (CAAX protease family)
MGVVWALAVRRTESLRFAIAGHALTDLLNLAVPTLMNLYVPGPRP